MRINRHYKSTEFITGLRAVAIIMVFLIHSGGAGLRELGSVGNRIVDFGKYGFTIFYQIFNKNYTFKDFIIVRLMRISIPYFPVIVLLFLFDMYGLRFSNSWAVQFNNGEISLFNLFMHIIYLSFIDIKYANSIIGVEWTLTIEVIYYFIISILIFNYKLFFTFKTILIGIISFFLLSFLSVLYFKYFLLNQLHLHWLPVKYGYMFLLGGGAFYVREIIENKYSPKKLQKLSNIFITIVVVSFMTFLLTDDIPNVGIVNEFVFSFLTFVAIIFFRDNSEFSFLFTNKIVLFIGSISFSFYLIHMIVLRLFKDYLDITIGYYFIVSLFISIIISFIWYLLFEKQIYTFTKKYYLEFKN